MVPIVTVILWEMTAHAIPSETHVNPTHSETGAPTTSLVTTATAIPLETTVNTTFLEMDIETTPLGTVVVITPLE